MKTAIYTKIINKSYFNISQHITHFQQLFNIFFLLKKILSTFSTFSQLVFNSFYFLFSSFLRCFYYRFNFSTAPTTTTIYYKIIYDKFSKNLLTFLLFCGIMISQSKDAKRVIKCFIFFLNFLLILLLFS